MIELEIYLEQTREMLDNYREVIKGINSHIEHEGFIPSESQQKQIDIICARGKELIQIVDKLEKLKRN